MPSTMRFTFAPRSSLSSSGEYTPSLSGMKRFSFVTAMVNVNQVQKAIIHLPARYCEIFHGFALHNSCVKTLKEAAETLIDLGTSPVGFLVGSKV